jgi:hypothetical protein
MKRRGGERGRGRKERIEQILDTAGHVAALFKTSNIKHQTSNILESET